MKTVFENDYVRVVDNEHDYDFVGYIENKTDKVIKIHVPEFPLWIDGEDGWEECEGEFDEDSFTINPNYWIGMLADRKQKSEFDTLSRGEFEIEFIN